MDKKDLKIEDWNPDWNDTTGVVWAAEWGGPEEPLSEEELKYEFMNMVYNGDQKFTWYYPEIVEALDSGVDKFLAKFNISETDENIKELEEFFKHYIWMVSLDNKLRPPMSFDFEGVEEGIGDDLLNEIADEYSQLGKNIDFSEIRKKFD